MTATTPIPETGSLNVIDLDKFKDCVLFAISIRRWGNRAQIKDMNALQAYIELMKADPDPNATEPDRAVTIAGDGVSSAKRLIRSKALDALNKKMSEIKSCCLERAMPSYFRTGMFVVKQNEVAMI